MKKWYGLLIAFVLLVAIGFLWHPSGLKLEAQRALAVAAFAIVIWFTQAMSDAVSAIFIVLLLAGLKAVPIGTALSGYSNTALWLIVIGFVMAAAMEKTGLSRRIALRMVGAAGGKSRSIYWAVFAVMVVLTFLVPSITARTLLMLPILLGIGEAFGAQKGKSSLMKALLFIVAMSGTALSIGVLTAHVGNPITTGLIEKATGHYVSWSEWLRVGGPPALILGILSVPLIMWIWPPEVNDIGGGLDYIRDQYKQLGAISRDEMYVLIVFTLTVLLWATDSFHKMNVTVVGFASMALLLFPKYGALTWKEAQSRVPWNVFVLYGAGLSLGSALVSTKAAEWLAKVGLAPITGMSIPMQVVSLIWLVTLLQVLFTGGGPKTTALTPIIIAHATAIGVNPIVLALPLGMNMQHQYLLPVSNMPNAVIVGTEHVSQNDMLRTGLWMSLLGCAFFTLVVFTYWSWIGLF